MTNIPAFDWLKRGWQNPMSTFVCLSLRGGWHDHDDVNIHVTLVMWSHDRVFLHFSWRPHFNVPYAYQRLCVVQTAGRVAFVYISTWRSSGFTWYRQRVLSLSLYGTSGSLCFRYLFMFVSFNKGCLFSDLYQTSFGRRNDKTNVRW